MTNNLILKVYPKLPNQTPTYISHQASCVDSAPSGKNGVLAMTLGYREEAKEIKDSRQFSPSKTLSLASFSPTTKKRQYNLWAPLLSYAHCMASV